MEFPPASVFGDSSLGPQVGPRWVVRGGIGPLKVGVALPWLAKDAGSARSPAS